MGLGCRNGITKVFSSQSETNVSALDIPHSNHDSEKPLASQLGREIFPGPGISDDDDLEQNLRERVELLYHPVGTCRMGTDDGAVIDDQLRVRGVEGLRVADGSIMPLIPGGNTNAPCIMVGERAADLVKGLVAA